jgi:uncharacterized protein YdaU (DUF1376 family)
MIRPWMPLYVADYLADTSHLGAAESGAYLHLIMHYWLKGSLPQDHKQLAKIARMSLKQFNRALPIIAPFFNPDWTHNRIDQELEKVKEISEKRRGAVLQRKDRSNTNVPTNVEQKNTHSHSHSHIQSKSQSNIQSKSNNNNTLRATPEFDLFWSAYPNKVKKFEALKAWHKAIKTEEPLKIIEGLKNFRFSDDPQFNPHPSTWLNQRRWLDEPLPEPKKKMTALEKFVQKTLELEKQEQLENQNKEPKNVIQFLR